MGVEVVYQDLAIVPNMTAPYNLFLGRIPKKFGIFVDEKQMRQNGEILAELKVEAAESQTSEMLEASNKALPLGGPSLGERR